MGPLVAPIVSGYITPVAGWRWVFWFGLVFAGASGFAMLFLPETYSPILLTRRAAHMRKSTGNPNIFAPMELEKQGFKQLATVTLTRPLRMLFFELIVSATCVYVSLAYAIFYMYFPRHLRSKPWCIRSYVPPNSCWCNACYNNIPHLRLIRAQSHGPQCTMDSQGRNSPSSSGLYWRASIRHFSFLARMDSP